MNPAELSAGDCLPLVRSLGCYPDSLSLYASLCEGGNRADTLLLESADQSTSQGEKSLLVIGCSLRLVCRGRKVSIKALNPNGEALLPWLMKQFDASVKATLQASEIHAEFPPSKKGSEEERLKAPFPVDVLRLVATSQRLVAGEASLGPLVVGTFAYDFFSVYEELPNGQQDEIGFMDYELWLPDQMIWINHQKRSATALAHVYGGEKATEMYHDATKAISVWVEQSQEISSASEPNQNPPSCMPSTQLAPAVDMGDNEFAQMVERLKQHIVEGDVIQIVPSRTFSIACSNPLLAYRELRKLNPSPYMFFIHGSCGVLFGASPETAVKVQGVPKRVEIRPIAGTRPRARDVFGQLDLDQDNRLEAELKLDKKELAEHMMLVDLARNDVARVSEPGTRRVDRLLTVDKYSHVMHLVSYVSGQLRSDLDALHAYVATMNMGTLVGAPKIKAAQLLRHYEVHRRGPYGGAVGYFTSQGDLDTCIVIRSAHVMDGLARVRAGAGVVFDSVPSAEAMETRKKADAVLVAIGQPEGRRHA